MKDSINESILEGRAIASYDIPDNYKWPISRERRKLVFDTYEKGLDKLPFHQNGKATRSKIALFSIDFVPTVQNLELFCKEYSSHCKLGDIDDMYFLADLAHTQGKDSDIYQHLKCLAVAPASIISDGKVAKTAFIVNHGSTDCRLRAGVHDINKTWNFKWNFIAHFE